MNNIHKTAVIYDNVKIGDNVTIGPFCIIGAPAEWKGHEGSLGVEIKDGAILTGHVTVDAGANNPTVIGKDCYLMKHSHVGHDAELDEGVTVSCGAKIGGHTRVNKGVNIGLNAVIHQKQVIAEGCMIGMGSVVTKSLATMPYNTYAGNPAKWIGTNDKHPNYIIYQKQMA
jgi:UDP-N-acetylglucosamine acyltransferase